MTLHEKLIKKIHEEQKQYLAEIEKLPPKEIIHKAYEICYRNEFVFILENCEHSEETTKRLLALSNPIAILYDDWLNTDGSICEMLEDVINGY